MKQKIKPGAIVEMHFRITLGNGYIAEDTFPNEPFKYESGDGSLIEALDEFLLDLQSGDSAQLIITPEQGYGHRDDANIMDMPLSDFSESMSLQKGQVIGFESPSGEEVPGSIVAIEKEKVTVDFNHPFAGHDITFDVEILSVQ